MCEVVDAIFGDSNHVFNSASVLAEEVNSGLYGEYFTYVELSAKATGLESRALVDEETYGVSE